MFQPCLRRLRRDEGGATALEFGLVMPLLALLLVGGMWGSLLLLSVNSLDMAVQSAARCMAVDANTCATPSATQTYALGRYAGPDISPVFTASASGCGHTVSAQATFDLNVLPMVGSVPLTASACYP